MCICVLQLQYMEYWCATSISILDSAIHLNDQVIQGPFFLKYIYFQKVCAFYCKAHEESGTKIEAKQSADKSLFFPFSVSLSDVKAR